MAQMQSLYACLMTEPILVHFSLKMTENVRVLGVPPPKVDFEGPFSCKTRKSAREIAVIQGPFLPKPGYPPGKMSKTLKNGHF